MGTYDEMIQNDVELLWRIQEYCYQHPWLNEKMSQIVSKNPWKDIVILNWIFFIVGLFEIGSKHFWVVTTNAIFAIGILTWVIDYFHFQYFISILYMFIYGIYWSILFPSSVLIYDDRLALRRFIEAKRPVEYDIRLQPMTDKSAESYGYDSFMKFIIEPHFESCWLLCDHIKIAILLPPLQYLKINNLLHIIVDVICLDFHRWKVTSVLLFWVIWWLCLSPPWWLVWQLLWSLSLDLVEYTREADFPTKLWVVGCLDSLGCSPVWSAVIAMDFICKSRCIQVVDFTLILYFIIYIVESINTLE